jgi:protein-S-isoprenylcysteine O-methyltransferase Ste14
MISEPMLHKGSFLREFFLWTGYAMVIFGAFGRVYCSAFIGGRKNDEIVRTGAFSVVRNPLYVFSFIAMVGIGLQSGMVLVTAILIATFTLYYPVVVAKEEGFLEGKFGGDYLKYKQEVPRWIPNLKLWNEPEQVDARPKFIRNTMMDAAIFFLPLPFFNLINYLQTVNMLPIWLTLP